MGPLIALITYALLMGACATTSDTPSDEVSQTPKPSPPRATVAAATEPPSPVPTGAPDAAVSKDTPAPGKARPTGPGVQLGTGVFVQPGGDRAAQPAPAEGTVTLNFEGSSLREFVRVIFEDILKENYLIDPGVDGVVTLHTSRTVTLEAVPSILETVLQLNGAALIYDQGIAKVIPIANAEGEAVSPVVTRQVQAVLRGAGFTIEIVPLAHVSAGEIEKILQPYVPQGSALRIDQARNLLILSGPRYRLDHLLETIEIFDVDWLQGMSFGLFPLEYAEAGSLVNELQKVIGDGQQGPLAGIVRLIPIERLNAVLVIAHRPGHMAKLRELIEDFDWAMESATPGRRLYVYNLKNGKAENIASVLQELFAQLPEAPPEAAVPPEIAPGLQPSVFRSPDEVSAPPPPVGAPGQGGDYPRPPRTQPQLMAGPSDAGPEAALGEESQGPVTIMADQDNNAIVVMASPRDYRAIEAAIRKLDIAPRQVLIDATIAEVTLNDSLDYGVRWFIDTSVGGLNLAAALNGPPPETASGDGLALALFSNSGDVRVFFDLLESVSSVKFLSAPQVLVLDNQAAQINVGDQIPVTVRSSQSTTDPNAPIVTEVQYRDTGTTLSVTPRINAGGQVTLEISQEVSLPGSEPAIGGGGNVAIAQRTINSTVVIQSGQTVVLGGLIRESRNDAKSGVPILMHMPFVGPLFSTTSEDISRTELIITISPTVVEDQQAALEITEELRDRLKAADNFESSVLRRGGYVGGERAVIENDL